MAAKIKNEPPSGITLEETLPSRIYVVVSSPGYPHHVGLLIQRVPVSGSPKDRWVILGKAPVPVSDDSVVEPNSSFHAHARVREVAPGTIIEV